MSLNVIKTTHCTRCGNELDDEEFESPRLDKDADNQPICDQCYREYYQTDCPLCEEVFDAPEHWAPNQFIYAPIGVDVFGFYRVLQWPFFRGPLLGDASYNDGAIELIKPYTHKKQDEMEGNFICPDCTKIHGLNELVLLKDEFKALLERFSADLLVKLMANEQKYHFGNSWKIPDWQEQLQRDIVIHTQKGDPRDTAIYSLFAWYHGWSTASATPTETIKTKSGWDAAGVNLSVYMPEPCEIDEEMYMYISEIVAPHYCTRTLTQGGDPEDWIEGYDGDKIYTYTTVLEVNGKYFYLGILPEFKQ